MGSKVMENIFLNVSEIEPELLRYYMINQVGEKAKDKLYNYLKDLKESYPDFENWFFSVVIPEIELKNGEREVIVVVSRIEGTPRAVMTGIAILKKKEHEKKICTFRIHEDYRNQGIGSELFERCFEYLGTRKPIITISQDRRDMFESHIINYDFKETQKLESYYRQSSVEYVYNGFLTNNV